MIYERTQPKMVTCALSGKNIPISDSVPGEQVRRTVFESIKKHNPNWDGKGYICMEELNRYRLEHVQELLGERGDLSEVEQEVLDSIQNRTIFAHDPSEHTENHETYGEALSDKIAAFGGSWKFIIIFGIVLFAWIIINAGLIIRKPFDPYPFILMNLILSCVAAIQAPVIMMSQNRQEMKDRVRSEHDYQVNLWAEIEIRALHEKMDRLMTHQWQHLLEIQQIQLDMMQEMAKSRTDRG